MTTKVKLPKKGDKVILKNLSSNSLLEGICIVTNVSNLGGTFQVRADSGQLRTVYSKDSWVYADRKEQKNYLQAKIDDLEEEMTTLQKELDFLEKYESEEDFVADKLDKILTAHKNGATAGSRRGAIADVLKELKESHLL